MCVVVEVDHPSLLFRSFFSLLPIEIKIKRVRQWFIVIEKKTHTLNFVLSDESGIYEAMHSISSVGVCLLLLLFGLVSAAAVQDERIIIGSSVGGVLGLVSERNGLKSKDERSFRSSSFSIWSLFLNYYDRAAVASVRNWSGFWSSSSFPSVVSAVFSVDHLPSTFLSRSDSLLVLCSQSDGGSTSLIIWSKSKTYFSLFFSFSLNKSWGET